jgi:hypothetical protein
MPAGTFLPPGLTTSNVKVSGGGTDNYVMTAVDSETIQGEQYLTFDGSTLTVTGGVVVGVDNTGHDVKFFGATTGTYMLWDENTDDLVLTLTSELYFYDAAGGEHIKSDGTDMTIYAGNDLNLTAVTDINIPINVGLTFAATEKIESDGTDLSITVGSNGDINVPVNIGMTFGDDGQKIESDADNLTIESGNNLFIEADGSVVVMLDANTGTTNEAFFIRSDGASDALFKFGENASNATTMTMGAGLSGDAKIVFDGASDDFYIGLEHAANDLVIGVGDALGTTSAIEIDNGARIGIGTAPAANYKATFGGAHTGSSNSYGLRVETEVQGVAANNFAIASIKGTLIEAGSGTHANGVGLWLEAPTTTTTGGATTNYFSTFKIDGPPDGAGTANYSMWVDAGTSRFDGAISLATDHGDDGQQLTSGGDDAACDWTAASSLRKYKNIGKQASPQQALEAMLNTPAYHFHYKEKKGTGDTSTEYVGVMADDAPWAMHYKGKIVNPVNSLGYTVLSVQALNNKIEKLEQELEALRS